jgi:GntR family transcriptional regulator, transcriptional repressor for pyruvate dehydrogenase complex
MAVAPSGGNANRRVRVSKTAELIADELRIRIARGVLKKGDVLPAEMELVKQFGVSRPTLREAFRILESESLIVVRRGSGGGVIVSSPEVSVVARNFGVLLQTSGVTLADVYDARKVLEPAAVHMFANRRVPQDIEKLNQHVENLAALVDEGVERANFKEWSAAALRFHDELVEQSGNTTLALFGAMLSEVISRYASQAVMSALEPVKIEAQFRRMIRAFIKLTTLIESGEADEAEQFWRRHLEIAGRGLLWGGLAAETLIDLYVEAPVLRRLNAP